MLFYKLIYLWFVAACIYTFVFFCHSNHSYLKFQLPASFLIYKWSTNTSYVIYKISRSIDISPLGWFFICSFLFVIIIMLPTAGHIIIIKYLRPLVHWENPCYVVLASFVRSTWPIHLTRLIFTTHLCFSVLYINKNYNVYAIIHLLGQFYTYISESFSLMILTASRHFGSLPWFRTRILVPI